MKAGEKKKTWDPTAFRRENMTFWPRSHQVMYPHLHTDHWSKMKTMVPVYLATIPAALLKDRVYESNKGAFNRTATTSSLLPPLTQDQVPSMGQGYGMHPNTPTTSPRNIPQYRNVFNDRARRDFCYWLIEKKESTCKGHSFGAYKTCLGLPRI